MSRTDAFANDFCRRMKEKPLADYVWSCSGKPIKKGHESIDVMAVSRTKSRKPILVEVELRKDAPLTNVVKVWRWISAEKYRAPFIFVQAFSKYYKEGDTKRANAEFIGGQMHRTTSNTYLPISFDYSPRRHGKQGAGRRRHHAYKLADQIRRLLRAKQLV